MIAVEKTFQDEDQWVYFLPSQRHDEILSTFSTHAVEEEILAVMVKITLTNVEGWEYRCCADTDFTGSTSGSLPEFSDH